MKITALTFVANQGHTVTGFKIEDTTVTAVITDISVSVTTAGREPKTFQAKVTSVEKTEIGLVFAVEPFLYNADFTVSGAVSFTKADVTIVKTETVDDFAAIDTGKALYRLYTPKCDGPRPLMLFLHGGGEMGSDNIKQMTGTIGAAKLAELYPEMYVMAPQAPGGISLGGAKIGATSASPAAALTALFDPASDRGWSRTYLAGVCDIIRKMIADGLVCADRVYVTGMSMGGFATLRAVSVARDLFAAAAPICPTMNDETYGILCGLGDFKIWASTAYVDYSLTRHMYLMNGIMKLRDGGNNNARLTLFSPEQLAEYGVGVGDVPVDIRVMQNHASWILVYNGVEGIMDWLTSQKR